MSQLAAYSNIALGSGMAVLTLSMLSYAGHLASLAPQTDSDTEAEPSRVATHQRRARIYAGIGLNLAWLSTALLVGAVVLRGVATSRAPWGTMFEFLVAACAVTMVVYCVIARRGRWPWLGVFVTVPVLLALGISVAALYSEPGQLMPALKSVWLAIHVSVAVLAVGFFTVAFPVALVHLEKTRERGPRGQGTVFGRIMDALPSASVLDRLAYGLNMIGFIAWTFTLVAGAIWAHKAWSSYWNWDPKEVWTFVVWVVYAAYMHGRATAGWSARRATWIAVAGYVCVLLNFFVVNVWFVGQHSYSGL